MVAPSVEPAYRPRSTTREEADLTQTVAAADLASSWGGEPHGSGQQLCQCGQGLGQQPVGRPWVVADWT